MTKVVINKCYGGFGLSHSAMLRYAELSGITVYPEKYHGIYYYWLDSTKDGKTLYDGNIERDDPILVQVVSEMGKKANGEFADLRIVEIPDGISWTIDDYDGMETVEETHRSWY